MVCHSAAGAPVAPRSHPHMRNHTLSPAPFAQPSKQMMERSASTNTLVGLEAHSTRTSSVAHTVRPRNPPKHVPKSKPTPASSDDGDSTSALSPRSQTKRRVYRTPEERKQRRLETNRAAAKRAYYRRQGKMNATKDDNDRLRQLAELQADRIRVYEAVLRQLGCDPEAAVEQYSMNRS